MRTKSLFTCLRAVPLRTGRRRVLPALIAVLNLIPAGRVTAQTFTTLHSFSYSDGASPQAGLILLGNTLYGTAYQGGSSDDLAEWAVLVVCGNGAVGGADEGGHVAVAIIGCGIIANSR